MRDFMDNSESNITPRLRTVWAQWMDEDATVRVRYSEEILTRLDLHVEPNQMSCFACEVMKKVNSSRRHKSVDKYKLFMLQSVFGTHAVTRTHTHTDR